MLHDLRLLHQQGAPAVLLTGLGNGQPLCVQSGDHFIAAGQNDAGSHQMSAGFQVMIDGRRQRNDHICHDIGKHDIKAAAGQAFLQRLMDKIGGNGGKAVCAKAVYPGIFGSGTYRNLINVPAYRFLSAQLPAPTAAAPISACAALY